MKLTIGWWKARDGSKWHVDWVGEKKSSGHSCEEWITNWNCCGTWIDDDGESDWDLISPLTEPKLRPWKPEEVPLGAQRRFVGTKLRWLITNDGDENAIKDWFKNCEHSTDGGKTWHPCGVIE